jgi:hypothetical protein
MSENPDIKDTMPMPTSSWQAHPLTQVDNPAERWQAAVEANDVVESIEGLR